MKTNTFKVCGPWSHPFTAHPLRNDEPNHLTPPSYYIQEKATTATPSILKPSSLNSTTTGASIPFLDIPLLRPLLYGLDSSYDIQSLTLYSQSE